MVRSKPHKPSPDFPLFAHDSGQWAKKINGKTQYFGKWEDPQGALEAYTDATGKNLKSDERKRNDRPVKPHPDFPLTAHPCGQWVKKIRGKLHYFGLWNDPDGALQTYLDKKDDLIAGRNPRNRTEGITVRELVNEFLTAKEKQQASGEITGRTFTDYYDSCERIIAVIGKDRVFSARSETKKGHACLRLRRSV